ncbi:putative enoyl-CoA hydratase, mitochondrial [Tyrophagus putrescentiae]|nr:putative enoyl-CoA hydratase, mitochondrial [Tyrophagus putrescentiae]
MITRNLFRQISSKSPGPLLFRGLSNKVSYEFIKVERRGAQENVGLVAFNRPKALNAISNGLMSELIHALKTFDRDEKIGAIIITGSEKLFTAGADIKQMGAQDLKQIFLSRFPAQWDQISTDVSKPIIAAVNGFAFGGGCEISLMADIVYAGKGAQFGLPEVRIGTCPGAGGTQRLTRAIGKSRAMEMILTGLPMTAEEALKAGLVSKIFPAERLLEEAVKLGETISEKTSKLTSAAAKAAVNASQETTLKQGLETERRLFQMTFATNDQKEGMAAFLEKRKANFTDS